MALREIVLEGDDVLNKKCRTVEKFDDRLAVLIDDMIDTLIDSGGVGLAAPQVGVLRRVVVIQVDQEKPPIELVNPEIIATSGEQKGLEGCLSLPGKWGIATRPYHVEVKAHNRHGKEFTVGGDALLARAFCHELDHLNGVLYNEVVDRMLTPVELEKLNEGELDISNECYIKPSEEE
ncbi:MAG: peptide deformylase [Ruminococcus sp.]|nr:peptide deformylase [Ruminococcus sp.]